MTDVDLSDRNLVLPGVDGFAIHALYEMARYAGISPTEMFERLIAETMRENTYPVLNRLRERYRGSAKH